MASITITKSSSIVAFIVGIIELCFLVLKLVHSKSESLVQLVSEKMI